MTYEEAMVFAQRGACVRRAAWRDTREYLHCSATYTPVAVSDEPDVERLRASTQVTISWHIVDDRGNVQDYRSTPMDRDANDWEHCTNDEFVRARGGNLAALTSQVVHSLLLRNTSSMMSRGGVAPDETCEVVDGG